MHRRVDGAIPAVEKLFTSPGLHLAAHALLELPQLLRIAENVLQDSRKRVDVSGRVQITALAGVNHFQATEDGIAQYHRQAGKHGFGNNQRAGIIGRRQNEEIGSLVKIGKLRSVYETKDANPFGQSQGADASFKLSALRAFPCEDEVNTGEVSLAKSFEEIQRPLPGLQFRAIQNDRRISGDIPACPNRSAIEFSVGRQPGFFVHAAANDTNAFLGNAQL